MSQSAPAKPTHAMITGLTNGTTYTFRVAATNENGTGAQSAPTRPAVVGTPSPPRTAWASAGNASATVTWRAPATTNGSPVTGYVVIPQRGSQILDGSRFNSTATTETVHGLTN